MTEILIFTTPLKYVIWSESFINAKMLKANDCDFWDVETLVPLSLFNKVENEIYSLIGIRQCICAPKTTPSKQVEVWAEHFDQLKLAATI